MTLVSGLFPSCKIFNLLILKLVGAKVARHDNDQDQFGGVGGRVGWVSSAGALIPHLQDFPSFKGGPRGLKGAHNEILKRQARGGGKDVMVYKMFLRAPWPGVLSMF